MFTLADMAQIETDVLRKSVFDTLLMESRVQEFVPWETIGALSTKIVRYKDLPSIGFRAIGGDYSEGNVRMQQAIEHIALMGVYCDTDKAQVRAKNTIAEARAIQQTAALKGMAYHFNDKFVNGNPEASSTTVNEFKGLKERIEDIRVDYSGQYIDNDGTSGDGILLNSAERHNFLDHVDQAMYAIKGHKPDMGLMNHNVLLALRSVLRREGLLDTTKDQFDRVVNVYGGCELQDIGVKADQTTEILPNTETLEDAGAAESTSIYFVRFGVGEYMWGIQEYEIEVDDIGQLEDGVTYRTIVDWPVGLAILDPYSVSRLYAIIPNAST